MYVYVRICVYMDGYVWCVHGDHDRCVVHDGSDVASQFPFISILYKKMQ